MKSTPLFTDNDIQKAFDSLEANNDIDIVKGKDGGNPPNEGGDDGGEDEDKPVFKAVGNAGGHTMYQKLVKGKPEETLYKKDGESYLPMVTEKKKEVKKGDDPEILDNLGDDDDLGEGGAIDGEALIKGFQNQVKIFQQGTDEKLAGIGTILKGVIAGMESMNERVDALANTPLQRKTAARNALDRFEKGGEGKGEGTNLSITRDRNKIIKGLIAHAKAEGDDKAQLALYDIAADLENGANPTADQVLTIQKSLNVEVIV